MDQLTSISITGVTVAIISKLLGKTAETVSDDLANVYKAGRNLIINAAIRKTSDIEDGKISNLRVVRDVFSNGSFTDEAICAEYFGGILAASRSGDGKDDTGVFYADIIKSLSSSQLRFHYIIYRSLNKLWLSMPDERTRPNAGMGNELDQFSVCFLTNEIQELGVDIGKNLVALHSKGLIGDLYQADEHVLPNGKQVNYTKVSPCTLGIQLYAIAHNKLQRWWTLPFEDFGDFPEINTPNLFAFSLDDLLLKI